MGHTVMKKNLIVLTLFAAVFAFAETRITEFNAENQFSGFNEERRLTHKIENGLLVLKITGLDSGIGNSSVNINPADSGVLEIQYRATGLPAKTGGQLYFSDSDTGSFNPKCCWVLPSLIADGKFHTMRLSAPLLWKKSKNIQRLRLDMVDQGIGGTIEIKSIRFRPAAQTKLSEWPAVKPVLPEEKSIVPQIPSEYFETAFISAESTGRGAKGSFF